MPDLLQPTCGYNQSCVSLKWEYSKPRQEVKAASEGFNHHAGRLHVLNNMRVDGALEPVVVTTILLGSTALYTHGTASAIAGTSTV
jgi:hypothetical protein